MQTEATSSTAVPMPCSHCGAALPEHVAVCPQCGAHVLLEVLPAAERVPPPTLLPARILRPNPTTIDQAGTILTAPPRPAQNDLNGARRWGMSRGAAILLFGFAIAFGTYVSITERDVALVKWQKVLYHNESPALPPVIGNSLPAPPTSVPLVALIEREIENSRAEDARDAQLAQNDLTKDSSSSAAAQKPAAAAVQKPAAAPAPVAAPPHAVKPKAPVVASVAPSREPASEPRKVETAISTPVEKTLPKPPAPDKPLVVTTAKPAAAPAAASTASPVVKAEAPPAPPAQPQPRPSMATEQRGDAIQRAAQACDKQDGTGCIRRQLTKTENIDRVEKAEQTAVLEASSAEPKAPMRERLTREPARAAAPASAPTLHAAVPASAAAPTLHAVAPAAVSSAAPTLFDAARKAVAPEPPAPPVRESAAGPAGEPPPPKAAPVAAPPQRIAALSEDVLRLYRGH
jgi:hypothetical protein